MPTLKYWDGTSWITMSYAAGRSVLAARPVLDVGVLGQIRAGRQLTVADFTNMGLAQPIGLWNLSDLTNLGSDGRALVNKGAVPFASGINGDAATAAQFAGNTAQALYIVDSGASDPYRIRTGSFGGWFRSAKRGSHHGIVTKQGATTAASGFTLMCNGTNNVAQVYYTDGSGSFGGLGVTDVFDDRWHFIVATVDATAWKLFVDGILEAAGIPIALINSSASGPLNIGGEKADSGTASSNPSFGRVDEVFVTADVLSEDQIRNLYCAKIGHGLSGAPSDIRLNVRRLKKGGPFAVADFPTQPLRLYNFTAQALTDQGSNNTAVTATGGITPTAGADGAKDGAYTITSGNHLQASDTSLPAALTSRSYGCWLKCNAATGGFQNILAWGATHASTDSRIGIDGSGRIACQNGSDGMSTAPFVCDGQWHFAVAVEDNTAVDGVKRKLYLDGRLVANSTVLNSITLGGANKFKLGANVAGAEALTGSIDGAFVCGYALTMEQVMSLYAEGSQAMSPSPKNAGDHIEVVDGTNILATFDTLDSQHQIDLGVAA